MTDEFWETEEDEQKKEEEKNYTIEQWKGTTATKQVKSGGK